MAEQIARYGPCTLGRRSRDPLHVLCASVIGQQLSAKAADTIQRRVARLIAAPHDAFEHRHFVSATQETLRACGVSNANAPWLLEIAARSADSRFNAPALAQLDDAALIVALDALPGIGLWTAEMMVIFAFDRLDMFSLGDVGLRNAVNQLYADRGRDGKPKNRTKKAPSRSPSAGRPPVGCLLVSVAGD